MTWVKICGMTNLEDALTAVDAGADAVGFVFYEKSPRNISVEAAREIVKKLPEGVEKIGVFVGNSIENAARTGLQAGFDALQVYLLSYFESAASVDLQPRAMGSAGLKVYPALPVAVFLDAGAKNTAGFALERPDGVFDTLILDSGSSQDLPGGTGKTFNWHEAESAVESLSRHQRIVIAGGLTSENVSQAMGILKPWGVDVASGVEARPGKKDPERVRAFVRAVREADSKAI
ncbi:MAG: phosphoribosylanthranilate isomerase [Candidatus Sulfotelmatobacter sp.]